MQFRIEKMMCNGCAQSVTQAIHAVDPQAKVDVHLDRKLVDVETDVERAAIARALESAGYPAHAV